jgi:hypothetical protein
MAIFAFLDGWIYIGLWMDIYHMEQQERHPCAFLDPSNNRNGVPMRSSSNASLLQSVGDLCKHEIQV